MPETNLKIRRQNRKNMMMRATANGIEVYIPRWLKKNNPQVRQFIEEGLKKFEGKIPETPRILTTKEQIRAMVADYAGRIGVQPKRITFRVMYKKWGSCSSRENITLNTSLTWLPPRLAEYIVCHEVVHLRVFNHGPEFKAMMTQYMPDWREREEELSGYRVG
jgi:predicted metal-dependent hydrolase